MVAMATARRVGSFTTGVDFATSMKIAAPSPAATKVEATGNGSLRGEAIDEAPLRQEAYRGVARIGASSLTKSNCSNPTLL